jgi:acetyl-CoA C-acetyltransferase
MMTMRNVAIAGVAMTAAGEHWEIPLRALGIESAQAALRDANLETVDAVVVANALGGTLSGQNHISALVSDYIGLRGVEAFRVEAADASGGVALRQAYLMIASGAAESVLVLGVEKVTDVVGNARNNALASMLDSEYEAAHGATPVAMAAMLMRRYMYEYGVDLAKFANFSVNAHANGGKSPMAMYRNALKADRFSGAPVVAEPINLFDVAPEADGAAALVLVNAELAASLTQKPVHVLASAVGTDSLSIAERADPLFLSAVNKAMQKALSQAGLTLDDIDLAELHDSATIMTTLSLEASGFAPRGEGWKLAAEGKIMLNGDLPISTFGGLKSRGNPLGATGVYQAAEVALQLRGQAGANQVAKAKVGLVQNLGGLGGTAVVHLLGIS